MRALCELADCNIQQVFGELLRVHDGATQGLCLLALGGYGRRMLFPYSDLDILFLFGSEKAEHESRGLIAEFSRTLWDLGFRVSSAGRTLEECKRIEEDNAEFHLALLDRRFLAGDMALFEKLDAKVLPASEKQARPFLRAQLHRLTKERITRYGNTIFHLEPNVKESPGGMRDHQAAVWLRQIVEERDDRRRNTAAEEELSAAALDFLGAIRCFLHYSNGRNDNTLTYELQATAAERALGVGDGTARTPAEWMRRGNQAHPLRRSSRGAVTRAERALRRGGLQLVSQRVVVAPHYCSAKSSESRRDIKGCGGKLFASAAVFFDADRLSSTICRSHTAA